MIYFAIIINLMNCLNLSCCFHSIYLHHTGMKHNLTPFGKHKISKLINNCNFLFPISLRLFLPATENEPSPFVVRATGGGTANQHRLSTKPSSLQRATSPTNEELSSDSDSDSMSDSDTLWQSGKKDSSSKKGGVLFEVRLVTSCHPAFSGNKVKAKSFKSLNENVSLSTHMHI